MKLIQTAPHEFAANYLFDAHALKPYFAVDRRVKDGGGKQVAEFNHDGERWVAKLYYQESGIVHPGERTPGGTEFSIQNLREFRLSVSRHPDEDGVGEQSFNAHIAPRWQGMEVENSNGARSELNVPEGIIEAVNVKIQGSNIEFERYQDLFQRASAAVGIKSWYFDDPHPYSNIQDAERYVRIDRDESGPIHARDGPITNLSHVLENDRTGYRKLVQNEMDERNRNLPGYYQTVTLGRRRIQEAWPDHRLPKEIKHYYAREAAGKDQDDPLAHPKLGASYQVSRDDQKLGVDELDTLNDELTEAVRSVLSAAGIAIAQLGEGGSGQYVEDAYFSVGFEEADAPTEIDISQVRHEQESIVIRNVADGLSPVQWESLETLVTDGGTVAPADIADENGRHVDSVYRALDGIEDMVDRQYGEVALRSDYVAEMVHDAVKEARDATRRAIETAAKSKEMAERGASRTMEEFVAWASRHGVDITNRSDGIEIDLGEVEQAAPGKSRAQRMVRSAFDLWKDAGQDPARFRAGTVQYNGGKTPAFRLL